MAAPSNSLLFSELRSGILNSNNVMILSLFNEMTTYQLCSWLYANSNILQLTNSMHISMQVLIANERQLALLSTNFSNLSNILQNQDNKVSKKSFMLNVS